VIKRLSQVIGLVLAAAVFFPLTCLAQAPVSNPAGPVDKPVVRAYLFWMEGCSHCHEVLDNVLPPIQEKYGDQVVFSLVELKTLTEIDFLYSLAEGYGIAKDQVQVPVVLIGQAALVGPEQIAAGLPGLIEQGLASGGLDYPQVENLQATFPVKVDYEVGCKIAVPCDDPPAGEQGQQPIAAEAGAPPGSSPEADQNDRWASIFTTVLGAAGVIMLAGAVHIRRLKIQKRRALEKSG
jgi:hypothetical protein